MSTAYTPQRTPRSTFLLLRGLRYHVLQWGDATLVTPTQPPLVLLHGWMDVAASYQFLVDALAAHGLSRWIIAPDWRGFGLTRTPPVDSYWFPDYLGDLDALLDALVPEGQIDLLGHSMGGNVVMNYAGVRPARIRRLINLEGFGMPRTQPEQAARRMAQWLDELRKPRSLRPYDSRQAVIERLCQTHPRLGPERADWLTPYWASQGADGSWTLNADPAHKHVNPVLYQVEEQLATWQAITARLLWVEGADTDIAKWWGQRYTQEEFHQRLAVVPQVQRERLDDCGHMLHLDQPQALAACLAAFLGEATTPA